MPLRCAILDDYQRVALSMADWSGIEGKVEINRFDDHIADTDTLIGRLADYDIIIAMRERTPFDAERLGRLPKLKLLITTGMANASIDMAAATRLGITVAGTRGFVGSAAMAKFLLRGEVIEP